MLLFEKITTLLNRGDQRSLTVKRNIVGSILIKGCSILISLLLVPLTLGYLSAELYGVWLTLSSVVLWLNFLDVGLTLGLKNKLAEALALGEHTQARSLVSTAYFTMTMIMVPLTLISELGIPWVDWSSLLNVDQAYNPELIAVVRILIACFSLQMIFNVITAVLAAFQRVALASAFPVIGNFVACLVIWLLTRYTESSLLNLTVAISFIPIVVLLAGSIFLYRGSLRIVRPSVSTIRLADIKKIFGLGIKFFIIQVQMVVVYQTSNILISNISSAVDVTAYNIAYKYLGVATMLFSLILGPLWPAFTDAFVKKEYAWMRQTYRRMVYLFGAISVMILLMMCAAPLAYRLWVGDAVEVPLLLTLSVGAYMIIHAWDSLQVILINGIGKVKLQTYVTLLGMILHIPLSFFLGNYLNMGAVGVVASMILINLLYAMCFTIQINKLIHNRAKAIWNA